LRSGGFSVFCRDVLEHLLVEAQVGDELLGLLVLLLELPQAPQLGGTEVAVLLLPAEECGLADPQLAADILDGKAASTCLRVKTICSVVNLDFFMGSGPLRTRASSYQSLFQNG
jgi:hypothetical protein